MNGYAIFGQPQSGVLEQMDRTMRHPAAVAGALMADNHKGYGVPIGAVVAYEDHISPTGVGYDIACGNKAVRLDIPATELDGHVEAVMDEIWSTLSFGVGRKNAESVDHDLFDDLAWQLPQFAALKDKAASQLGTIGSGNHYVDVFAGDDGSVWIGVHFGSRGFGHGVATWALKAGGASDDMDADPLVVPARSALGAEYLAGMNLAGRYAYAGRDWVCARVATLLGANIVEEVHNHHNFAWYEDGKWVVRKGATPAYPGQRGFVGGSMGEPSVILEGEGEAALGCEGTSPSCAERSSPRTLPLEDTEGLRAGSRLKNEASLHAYSPSPSLHSTVHGAGRVMSRTAAKGKKGKPGLISREDMDGWLKRANVTLRGAGLDEAPQAYKRLPDVLAAHADTIKILHTLTPLGVAMAGPNEWDPYKD